MNVDGVRAKMLGLKYQCLTFVFMGVRGLLTTNWGIEAKPSGLLFRVHCFRLSYGSFS